jgi:FtsH-binding integral membrane protein
MMKPWERRTFNALAFVVVLTGVAYWWMKYFEQTADPFSLVNHPWQPAMLSLHVVVSPAFTVVFGVILNSHIMKKLRATRLPNRRSGYVSLGTFAVMILSGYLLQVATSEGLLHALVVVHIGSGLLFSVAYIAHLVISAALSRAREYAEAAEVA